jgi:hypothetical protein
MSRGRIVKTINQENDSKQKKILIQRMGTKFEKENSKIK